jgi:hypothetical protein
LYLSSLKFKTAFHKAMLGPSRQSGLKSKEM